MDQSDIVNLRWNQHQATLVSVFDDLLDKEKLTDCTISAEGRHLRAHKIILCACSPYFGELFTENNEKDPIIILHDVKYDTIKALMDFMYRGELNVPQTELRGVFNLSEALQVRGLSGSGYVDNVSKQNISGINSPPPGLEDLLSQPASVSCFTTGQNDPEEKVQSFRVCSPTIQSQEGLSVGVDSLAKSIQKYRKGVNDSGSCETTDQHACQEVITSDLDSVHHVQSQRQVLPTMCDSSDGPVYSSSGQKTVAENEQFSLPVSILTDASSATLSSQQQELKVETKSEINEYNMEIEENISGDYNSVEIDNREARNLNEGLTNRETVHTQGSNNQHSPLGSDFLNNMTLTASQSLLHNQFSCQSCGKSYQDLSTLQTHLKYECGKERQFQCPHCSYRFAREALLKKHMTMTATCSTLCNRFTCYSCGKSYRYWFGLHRHMKYLCLKERQFQCPHCHFQCASSDKLKAHMANQHCQKEEKCVFYQ